MTGTTRAPATGRTKRPYDSPVRRQQVASTRERIVSAGSAIVHTLPGWDWRDLTFRAVAERAGVSERTVYRHFPTERDLRDAVMRRLEHEAGVTYEGVTIDRIPEVAARVFASLSAFVVPPTRPADPTFIAEDERRKSALLAAVRAAASEWTDVELKMAAAIFDVLWSVLSFERLTDGWNFGPDDATLALDWAIGVLTAAVRDGRRPVPGLAH